MLRIIFVSIIFSIGTFAAIRSRFGALLFYIWFALFMPLQWLWTDFSKYRPSLIIGLFLVLSCIICGVLPDIKHKLSISLLLFLFLCFISNIVAIDPDISTIWLEAMAKLIIVCLFLVSIVKTPKQYVILIAVIGASFAFHSAKAGFMAIAVQNPGIYAAGLSGAFADNNAYAIGSTMIIFFLIAITQNIKNLYLSFIFLICIPLSALTVIFTYSRSGFLALIGSTIFFMILQRRHRFKYIFSIVLIFLIFSLIVTIPSGYKQRIKSIITYDEIGDTSALGRLHFWKTAVNISKDNPLGIGLWCFESAYDSYDSSEGLYGNRRAAHNSFLQALVETGWLGGVLYAGIFLLAFIISFRIRARSHDPCLSAPDSKFIFTMSNALLCSLIAFLIGGFFQSMAYNDLIWLIFATIAALDRISQLLLSRNSVDLSGRDNIPTTSAT